MTAPQLADGRYELREQLGSGGMATVHRAHDTVLGRDVAIKALHPHLTGDPAFRERFLREGQAAAALTHPNVVAVHDLAADEQGARLVMELVDGPTLAEVLATRGRLSPGETLSLLGPAALGLAAAHRAGLVHRDVKPGNILIASDGTVKVGDFGLARAAASASTTFGADVLVGSPHYLAPEAVDGRPLGPTADVYALGVLLFEVLTGKPPFQGDSPMATALQHTTGTVPHPSSVVPGLPPQLDLVVQRATQRAPEDRYEDAEGFLDALEAAIPGGATPVDLRGGRHDTVVMPLVDLGEAGTDEGQHTTRVVLRRDLEERRAITPKPRGLQRLALALLAVALAGTVGLAVWHFLLAPVTDIPAVEGATVAAATEQLEASGFAVAVADQGRNSPSVPIGAVVAVEPGDQARKGATILLVPSLGPAEVVVPEVAGQSQSAAMLALREVGFEVEVVPRHDDVVAVDLVIGTNPPVNAAAFDGQTIELFVSLGRAPVTVPGVVGMPLEEALAALDAAGLDGVVVQERFDEFVPAGAVAEQAPEAEADAFRRDEVQLVVSKGPQPFNLPDVENQDADEAQQLLEELGLEVVVREVEAEDASLDGKVSATSPSAGTEVKRGHRIVLFVYVFNG